MKRYLPVFGLAVLFLLSTAFLPYKKFPEFHETLGELGDPIEVMENEGGPFWTFQDVTGCVARFEMALTLAMPNGQTPTYGFSVSLDGQLGQLSLGEIRAVSGAQGAFSVTHASVYVFLHGLAAPYDLYPGQPRTVKTTLPRPCDCLHLEMNPVTRMVVVTPGFGC
jgi:hypothetical protein